MTAYEKPAFEKGKTRVFGHSVLRIEDVPLVTGRGRYIADLNFPHQLHMRIVRSGLAHGITAINVDVAVQSMAWRLWTHADIGDLPPIDFRDPAAEGLKPYRQPLLALIVCAMWVSRWQRCSPSRGDRGDAAELVALDLSELPPQLDTIHPAPQFTPGVSTEALVLRQTYGDIEAAFRGAHCIVEGELCIGRHTGMPLECRGAIGRYDSAYDIVELSGSGEGAASQP